MKGRFKTYQRSSGRGTVAIFIFAVLIILISIAILTIGFNSILDSGNSSTPSTTTPTPLEENTVNTDNFETKTHQPIETQGTVISQTQTITPTSTSYPTPTSTPIPTPGGNEDSDQYGEFISTLYGEANVDAEVPLRIRGHVIADGEELIIIMNLTGRSENEIRRVQEVNTLVTSGFAQAVFYYDDGRIDGKIPNKLRIAEVNNTGTTPKTLYVNTSLARDYYLNNISEPEFSNKYWESERNMTTEEIQFVSRIDRITGNGTLYNGTASS